MKTRTSVWTSCCLNLWNVKTTTACWYHSRAFNAEGTPPRWARPPADPGADVLESVCHSLLHKEGCFFACHRRKKGRVWQWLEKPESDNANELVAALVPPKTTQHINFPCAVVEAYLVFVKVPLATALMICLCYTFMGKWGNLCQRRGSNWFLTWSSFLSGASTLTCTTFL